MKKLRISFSVFVALLLFGILSSSVFAAPPAKVSKITSAPVGETGIKVTWAKVADATGYNVYWGNYVDDEWVMNLVVDNEDVDFYEATGITPGQKYKFAIEAVNATAEVSERVTIDAILGLNQIYTGPDTTPVENINSNQTGFGTATNDGTNAASVVKSIGMLDNDGNPGTHKTHGDYQNNTNSCASCHQTHTASAGKLLFKNGTYATCTACHDGTLGFYDVFGESHSGAGTFGGTEAGNMSVHMANGSVQVKAAPGGNKTGAGGWTADFTCASCHSPHGSFSDRLLHASPAGMAAVTKDQGGIALENVGAFAGNISDAVTDVNVPGGMNTTAVLKYVELTGFEKEDPGSPFYNDKNATVDGDTGARYALMLYEKVGASWNPGILLSGSGSTFTSTLTGARYNPQKGYVIFSNSIDPAALSAKIAKPYIVKFDFDPTPDIDPATGVDVKKTVSAKSGVNEFCLACHTDYLGGKGRESIWDPNKKLWTHSINNTSRSCVSCHFAHGTDVTIMKDAKNRTVADLVTDPDSPYFGNEDEAKKYMLDNNVSSALKKYTNQSVCWQCHNSSRADQLINAPRNEDLP